MVVVPPPTMVTTSPTIVATVGFELVYVIEPLLFVVGGVIVNAEFPNVFAGTEKLLRMVGSVKLTVNTELIDPDL